MAIGIELAASGERPPYSHTRTARRSADGEAAEAGRTQVSSFSTQTLSYRIDVRRSKPQLLPTPPLPHDGSMRADAPYSASLCLHYVALLSHVIVTAARHSTGYLSLRQ